MTRSRPATVAGIIVAVATLVVLAAPGVAQAAVTERVSVTDSEAQGNDDSYTPSVSTDGRFVAFQSGATNLVSGDTNGQYDIFVRDRVLGTTERVSVSSSEAQANGASGQPSISADGRYVAFKSTASNLVSADTNECEDVFVRDRALGTTTRVSVSTVGVQGGSNSYGSSISADGRYVAFQSGATNLVSGDTNSRYDIFVRDTQSNITTRVSVTSSEAQVGADSETPSISADGRYVAFRSAAADLVTDDANGTTDVFVRDRTEGTTTRVSVGDSEEEGDGFSDAPAISANGRFVAFASLATNLVADDTNGKRDIFVRDCSGGHTTLVSVSTAGVQGNGGSMLPSISANGRYVAFMSEAANLVGPDTNGDIDVFVRDLENDTTLKASVATAGTQGDSYSTSPSVSADGRLVAFQSQAGTLVPGDSNERSDAFAFVQDPYIIYNSIRGSDRYDTAIRISKAMFPGTLPAGSALVLAPGETFQEALCGAPLAAVWEGPVLLTPGSGLNNAVRAELERLQPDYVFCIGLSNSVVTAVAGVVGAGAVELIPGPVNGTNVYAMSRAVANAMKNRAGHLMDDATAIITIGTNFPDAISVSPLACGTYWPILLTDKPDDSYLHAEAAGALADLGLTKAIKAGTYATLPTGVNGVKNVSGADRYFTNANVAAYAVSNGVLAFDHIGITTGEKFPDALASGPYLAQDGGLLFLTPLAGPLPVPVGLVIVLDRDDIWEVSFIAMIEPVISLVKALLH